jgi:GMP reductase
MATGFSRPQFSTVLECCKVAKKPVISDGAIKNVGDITKAMVAGATMIMCGNLFAGYHESAGERIEIEGKSYKQYFGSASYNNTRDKRNVEGKCILVDYKGEMEILLEKIEDAIRSSISYAGGLDLSCLPQVEWGVRMGGVR